MAIRRRLDTVFTSGASMPLYLPSSFAANPIHRYSALSLSSVANGSKVASIPNLGSTPGAMISNSDTFQPTKRISTRPYLEFDGTGNWMQHENTDSYIGGGAYTTYALCRFRSAAAGVAVAAGGSGNGAIIKSSSGELQLYRSNAFSSTLAPGDDWRVLIGVFNGDSSVIRQNGGERTGSLGTQSPAKLEVGRSTSTTTYTPIDIIEFGMYDRALSSSERSSLTAFLRSLYSVKTA